MFRFHVVGEFSRITTEWTADSRPSITEIETEIERAWQTASRRPGVKLFDGPMCRLESFQAAGHLHLKLSRTSYKPFLGTNLTHGEFADRFGATALANPVGLSCALETADGFLMLGRRNAHVAYYPSHVHPFAGALEPRDPMDVFAEARRELNEELGLTAADLEPLLCLGIAEDSSLHQPELIFHARCHQSRVEVESQLDAAEHTQAIAIAPVPQNVSQALVDPMLTPIARATLLLWAARKWGGVWASAFDPVPGRLISGV